MSTAITLTANKLGPKVKSTRSTPKAHNTLTTEQLHDAIVSRKALGHGVSLIARELGVTRQAVYKHLRNESAIQTVHSARLAAIIPDAIEALHKSIKAGDGKLALQLLKDMNAVGQVQSTTGDTTLSAAINVLIQAPSTVSPGPTIDAITVDHTESTESTEAGAKAPQDDLGVDKCG